MESPPPDATPLVGPLSGPPVGPLVGPVAEDARRLLDAIGSLGSCAIAFSAGVDSAVVVRAAAEALGGRAVAVTGVGPALPAGELEAARALATQVGIRHVETPTDEIHDAAYTANAPDRCYHCKTELYTHVRRAADELGLATIVNGANADDTGDHRPGMRAADEHAVRSPLLECGLGKEAVRRLAKAWGLPVWDKPAAPCLASRVAYGVEVTPERLARIDAAERFLRARGLREVRVRCHAGEVARIEAPAEWLTRLAEESQRVAIVDELLGLGFKAVTLDLAGFRSGSLNTLVPLDVLEQHR